MAEWYSAALVPTVDVFPLAVNADDVVPAAAAAAAAAEAANAAASKVGRT